MTSCDILPTAIFEATGTQISLCCPFFQAERGCIFSTEKASTNSIHGVVGVVMAKVGRRGHASDLRILISSSAGTSMLDVSLRSKNCETLDDISHFFQKQYFDEV